MSSASSPPAGRAEAACTAGLAGKDGSARCGSVGSGAAARLFRNAPVMVLNNVRPCGADGTSGALGAGAAGSVNSVLDPRGEANGRNGAGRAG